MYVDIRLTCILTSLLFVREYSFPPFSLRKQPASRDATTAWLLVKLRDSRELKGAVSRTSTKLGNYKMPVKLRET